MSTSFSIVAPQINAWLAHLVASKHLLMTDYMLEVRLRHPAAGMLLGGMLLGSLAACGAFEA